MKPISVKFYCITDVQLVTAVVAYGYKEEKKISKLRFIEFIKGILFARGYIGFEELLKGYETKSELQFDNARKKLIKWGLIK